MTSKSSGFVQWVRLHWNPVMQIVVLAVAVFSGVFAYQAWQVSKDTLQNSLNTTFSHSSTNWNFSSDWVYQVSVLQYSGVVVVHNVTIGVCCSQKWGNHTIRFEIVTENQVLQSGIDFFTYTNKTQNYVSSHGGSQISSFYSIKGLTLTIKYECLPFSYDSKCSSFAVAYLGVSGFLFK